MQQAGQPCARLLPAAAARGGSARAACCRRLPARSATTRVRKPRAPAADCAASDTVVLTVAPASAPEGPAPGGDDPAPEAPATRPVSFSFRFVGILYDDLMANATLAAELSADVEATAAAGLGVPADWVEVTGLRAGSVVADVTISAPGSWTDDQIRDFAAAVAAYPRGIFSAAFLAKYGITDVSAAPPAGAPAPAAPAAGLARGAQAGVALGVIAAAGAAAGGAWFWRQRRAPAGGAPVFDDLAGGRAV